MGVEIQRTPEPKDNSAELEPLRQEIDEIDTEVVGLLARRMRVATEIKKTKNKNGTATFDPAREGRLKARIAEMATEQGLSPDFAVELYEHILVESKRVQDSL